MYICTLTVQNKNDSVFLTLPNSWYLCVSQYNGLYYSLYMKKLHLNSSTFYIQTLQHFKQNNMWRQLSNYIPITKNETSESHFLKSMLIFTKGNVASEKIPQKYHGQYPNRLLVNNCIHNLVIRKQCFKHFTS